MITVTVNANNKAGEMSGVVLQGDWLSPNKFVAESDLEDEWKCGSIGFLMR